MPYIGTQPTKVVSRQSANVYRYEATSGQTAFTGADLDNNVLACNPADMIVHMNGLRLESTDYTATSTTVTLTAAATAGDEVTVTSFQTFEVADTYTKTTADNRYVNTTGDTMTGNLTVADGTNAMHVEVRNGTNWTGRFAAPAVGKSAIQYFNGSSWANGVEVDSAGRVTMPYQPSFRAGMNANTFATGSGGADINYNLAMHNVGNHYSTSTGTFTCPVSGIYKFTHSVSARTVSTQTYELKIIQNGVERTRQFHKADGAHGTSVSIELNCAANDAIKASGYWGGGVTLSGNQDISSANASQGTCSFFSGYLIG